MSVLGYPPREAFGAALKECKEYGVKLLILDSLGPALQGDAEAARDVIGFYQRVLEPFRAAGVTVLIIDHQARLQGGERYQSKGAFGSVFKTNLARSVIQAEATDREENTLTVRLRQKKHNFGPLADPFEVELKFTEEMVTLEAKEMEALDLAEEQTLTAPDRIKLALRAGPKYPEELAEDTGMPIKTVRNTLSKLRKAGVVEPTGEREGRSEQVRLTIPDPNPSIEVGTWDAEEGTLGGRESGDGDADPPPEPAAEEDRGSGGPRSRRLSAEEERRVRKLIREGMAPEWARREVLKEWEI
jgi:DNA-binding transcriptional ArsR family regulator